MIGKFLATLIAVAAPQIGAIIANLLGPTMRLFGIAPSEFVVVVGNTARLLKGTPPVYTVVGGLNSAEHERIVVNIVAVIKNMLTQYKITLTDAEIGDVVYGIEAELTKM